MKTAKMKSATVYGFNGRGATVSEAKADAVKMIERQNEGYWTPMTLTWRSVVAFIYRDLSGWNYVISDPVMHAGTETPCVHYEGTKEDAIKAARWHLGQWKYDPATDGEQVPEIITDADQRNEFRRWAEWQVKCHDARTNGKTPDEARAYADGYAQKDW